MSARGYCCSQIMVALGYDALEDENTELFDAMHGLCKGLYSGLVCGTLTGGACLLSMVDSNAAIQLIPRLVEWFEMTYTDAYGGIACAQILDDNLINKYERCPKIMEQTFDKCRELLSETGHAL